MQKKLSNTAYGGISGSDYVPFEQDEQLRSTELNTTTLIIGIILATVFAASTAYSGMKAGLTVAAGIPGAILASGLLRAMNKRNILGANIVQGMSSGGESIASGMIFVLPSILVIGAEFTFFQGALVGLAGALIGVGVSAIVEKNFIVDEHGALAYPESMAISETLVGTDQGGEALKYMGIGFGIGAVFTLISDSFFNFVNKYIDLSGEGEYKYIFGVEVNPMLLGLGFIVGIEVAMFTFAGGILSKFMVTPALAYFSQFAADGVMAWNDPTVAVNTMSSGDINGAYTKYIGAGAMLGGGFISAINLLPVIVNSVKQTIAGSKASGSEAKSNKSQAMILLSGFVLAVVAGIMISKGNMGMAATGIILSIFFACLFAIVAGRLTGVIGTSNLPVSGMTIASIVMLTVTFVAFGFKSTEANRILLLFGTIIVTAIATAGGYLQSQKATFVVGGTKSKMQRAFVIAAAVGVFCVTGITLLFSNEILNGDFAIPQANLMATLTKGIMNGDLPWTMIFAGVAFSFALYFLKLPMMTVAIGFYLPMETSSIMLVGALVRVVLERKFKDNAELEPRVSNGVSLSSGLIAGSSILGIIGAIMLSVSSGFSNSVAARVENNAGSFLYSNTFAIALLVILVIVVAIPIFNSKVTVEDKDTE